MGTEKYMLVVSMNPSIDVTMSVPCFRPGGTNRAFSVREDAGGKGVNVARALGSLKAGNVVCAGFLWNSGGEIVRNALEEACVDCDFVALPGSLRRNIKVFDEEKGEVTEINAQSPQVEPEDIVRARAALVERAKNAHCTVLTGSLPKGCGADFYADLIRENASPCALDADGDVLRAGVQAKPYIVKCNESELCAVADGESAVLRAKVLVDQGVSIVLASMGEKGSVIADASGAWRALPIKLNVRSTVGAGDAMLSGFLAGSARGFSHLEAFRYAVACASYSVEGEGTCVPEVNGVAGYLAKVKLERMMEW